MISKRSLLIVVVMAIPVLMGSQCVFIASSGNNDSCKSTTDKSCDSRNKTAPVVVVAVDNGQLIDAPVQGVRYESGSISGITGHLGELRQRLIKSDHMSHLVRAGASVAGLPGGDHRTGIGTKFTEIPGRQGRGRRRLPDLIPRGI